MPWIGSIREFNDLKSILITGCSSGIGYDAAFGLKEAGWRVFASCRSEKDCNRLSKMGLETVQLDYANEGSINAAFQEVLEKTMGFKDRHTYYIR